MVSEVDRPDEGREQDESSKRGRFVAVALICAAALLAYLALTWDSYEVTPSSRTRASW